MKITARIALLVVAFVSLTGIIGGGIFVHQHSGQGSGGQTLTGTTINNPIITGATLTGTINNPTITGTINGTPIWSSTQSLNTSGNAATVTTNANLTGPITSSGNATSITSGNTYPSPTFTGTVSGTPTWASGQTFPNVTASTSVVTPLVGTDTAVNLALKYNGSVQFNINSSGFFPAVDNTVQVGSSGSRVSQFVGPIWDSGTTGSLSLKTNNGTEQARVIHGASAVNFFGMQGGGTGAAVNLWFAGSDTNVAAQYNLFGTGSHTWTTGSINLSGGGVTTQFQVLHTASASRNITVTGSNGGDPTISTTAGNLNVGTTLTSTKACATNYTRVTPNYCRHTTSTTAAWTDATACTGRVFADALPADAKLAVLQFQWQALANNAIANRTNNIVFWSDTACTSATMDVLQFTVREWVATVAATVIGEGNVTIIVPLSATNTFRATQLNAGGNGNVDIVQYLAIGYFD